MAIDKNNRYLAYLEPLFHAAIIHLDLEGVTIGANPVEIDLLQHFPPETLETAGTV